MRRFFSMGTNKQKSKLLQENKAFLMADRIQS